MVVEEVEVLYLIDVSGVVVGCSGGVYGVYCIVCW